MAQKFKWDFFWWFLYTMKVSNYLIAECSIPQNYKVVQFWKFLSPRSYLSFISAFPHFECKIMWVERCETKPSSSGFFCKSIISIDRKEERLFLHFVHPFFQQTFLFNFFEVTKDFQAQKRRWWVRQKAKKLFLLSLLQQLAKRYFSKTLKYVHDMQRHEHFCWLQNNNEKSGRQK